MAQFKPTTKARRHDQKQNASTKAVVGTHSFTHSLHVTRLPMTEWSVLSYYLKVNSDIKLLFVEHMNSPRRKKTHKQFAYVVAMMRIKGLSCTIHAFLWFQCASFRPFGEQAALAETAVHLRHNVHVNHKVKEQEPQAAGSISININNKPERKILKRRRRRLHTGSWSRHSATEAEIEMETPTIQSRIIGGVEAQERRYPYMAALFSTDGRYGMERPICGGALIAPRIVLTAAHCVGSFDTVVLGLHDLNKWGTEHIDYETHYVGSASLLSEDDYLSTVVNIFVYPQFVRTSLYGDVALIRLNISSNYPPVAINMDTNVPHLETKLVTMGWGYSDSNFELPTTLLETTVASISEHECKQHYQALNFDHMVQSNVLCALTHGNDPCQGDSGGPLIFVDQNQTDTLMGVVSWGFGCSSGYPGAYARVSSMASWVLNFV
jgi:hypothetical protein